MSQKKFYLTTPIYYVNARPHIGHAYSTIAADVIARRHRLLGDDTFFLTGTDEHGQKVQRSAANAGVPPQQFTDEVSATFRNLWKRMGITNDDYIRTTEERHKRGVQKLWKLLEERGFIYLSTYTGQYSIGEEMFVEGPPGTIGPDGKPTETVTEENYFFKLSEFQKPLLDFYEANPDFISPAGARNEVLSFVRGNVNEVLNERIKILREIEIGTAGYPMPEDAGGLFVPAGRAWPVEAEFGCLEDGTLARTESKELYVPGALKDLSISRTTFDWGIPVPGNEKHVIYVWLDALVNYITAIGYGSDDPSEQEKFAKYWPADIHLVGKEITRFHCVYWPAFLMAAGLPLPKSVVANGWLLFEESKMSKSRGNIVRTETILDAFGTLLPKPDSPGPELSEEYWKHQQDLFGSDVVRYFLLREIPFGQDGSFSFDALVQRYNSDLANGYGNLVSRTLSMIQMYFEGSVPEHKAWGTHLIVLKTSEEFKGGSFTVANTQLAGDSFAAAKFYDLAFEKYRFTLPSNLPLNEVGLAGVIDSAMFIAQRADEYIAANAPWKLAKDPSERANLADVLYSAVESIRILTALLYPVLPNSTAKVWEQLGLGDIEAAAKNGELKNLEWGGLKPGTKLGPLSPIFPRAPKELIQVMADMETPSSPAPAKFTGELTTNAKPDPVDSTAPDAPPRTSDFVEPNAAAQVGVSGAATPELPKPPAPAAEAPASGAFATSAAGSDIPDTPQIAIDDFVKVDLRVAQIVVAERIPKADKLLRLEVDLGYERRQILSGIAEWYTPEELIGRKIVVIANLAPRKMRGLESHGMLLAASHGENGKPVLATFGEEIALGSRLK